MSPVLHPMLNTAIKAARGAGSIINRASLDLDTLRVTTKSTNDFVTEVDQRAEESIIETLLGAYPGHGILAEESGRAHGAKDSDYVWIIDPLDGTTNFIHGYPVYAVSIALQFRGQIQQGVVYDPTRNDLFYASKGRGAFLNDRRLRVSKRTRLVDCVIGNGFPFRKGDDFRAYLQMLELVMPACTSMRRSGSAALDLCHVAAGYTDGFFQTGLSPWDIAAGALFVTEAGGLVGNFTGESDFLERRELIAASPRIYGQLVALLKVFSQIAPAEPRAAAQGASTLGVTPEDALAAGFAIQRDPAAPPPEPAPAPIRKTVTRIRKEDVETGVETRSETRDEARDESRDGRPAAKPSVRAPGGLPRPPRPRANASKP